MAVPDDARLGERGVDDPIRAELVLQSVGDAEHSAELADVFTHEQHVVVILQRAPKTGPDRLRQGQLGHRVPPSIYER